MLSLHNGLIGRLPNSEKAYGLPDTPPQIPLMPIKPIPRAESPEVEVLDTLPTTANGNGEVKAGMKRPAEDDGEVEGKRRKVQVVDDDDDFEII